MKVIILLLRLNLWFQVMNTMQSDQYSQTHIHTQSPKGSRKRKGDPIKIIRNPVTGEPSYSIDSPNLNIQNVQGKQIPSDDSSFLSCQNSSVQSESGGEKSKIYIRSGLNSEDTPKASETPTPSDEDGSTGLTNDDVPDSPETDHNPETFSEAKNPKAVDYSIRMEIDPKASKSFFLSAGPVLELEKPIKLTKKHRQQHFKIDPRMRFMARKNDKRYCYFIFLRFNNVREAFKTTTQVRSNGLLQICKDRFPARLDGFRESEFGNEIILDASFQILTFRVESHRYRDLGVSNQFNSLFSDVFDVKHSEDTDVLELVREAIKSSKGFKKFSDVLEVYSAYDIKYSGILSEKKKVFNEENNTEELNSGFMTLDVNVEKIKSTGGSESIKRFCVNFLSQPIFKRFDRSDFTSIYNSHLEVDVEFEN